MAQLESEDQPGGDRPHTYEDYRALPDDGRRHEIIEGKLFAMSSPGTDHQEVAGNLLAVLYGHVKQHELGKLLPGPIDVILEKVSVVVPDIVFVSRERLGIVRDHGIEGAPDLIVEILSRETERKDRVEKVRLYARHGVRHYWLADPRYEILETRELIEGLYRVGAGGGDETLSPTLFPGLT